MLHRRACSVKSSYYDRPETSERIFYIYNLSRYNNRPHYHFGETCDLYYTELLLKSRVPIYTRICYHPIHVATDGITEFHSYIRDRVSKLPPPIDLDNVFSLDDATEMEAILAKVDAIFAEKDHSNQ